MLQIRFVASPVWSQQSTMSMKTQPCWVGALAAWLSAQKFKRERKTADRANTDRADLLVRLILVFPVFAVNISLIMTLAVTS